MLRVVASGRSHKLRRSGSPPRGVAAARCTYGAHPLGVLLQSLPSDSSESGGRRHPHAPAAIPRSARLRLRWRRTRWVFYWQPLPQIGYDPKKHLRPPVARASRCRWALQPISLLGTNPAGRLTHTRWISYWPPLPSDSAESSARSPPAAEGTHSVSCWQPLPKQVATRKESTSVDRPHRENRSCPARRENPVQKQFMLLNDFLPHPRRAVPLGTRNGQPLPLQVSTQQEKTALGPGRPRVPAVGKGQPIPKSPQNYLFVPRRKERFGAAPPPTAACCSAINALSSSTVKEEASRLASNGFGIL